MNCFENHNKLAGAVMREESIEWINRGIRPRFMLFLFRRFKTHKVEAIFPE